MATYNFYKRQFHLNSSVNPETKRRIKVNGPVYNKLIRKYGIPLHLGQNLNYGRCVQPSNTCDVSTTSYFGITGIKDIDKEVLLLLDFKTIFNLYATNKTLKLAIEESLPKLLRIHNPTDDDLVTYCLMLDIFQHSNSDLLDCLLANFKRHDDQIYESIIFIKKWINFLHLYEKLDIETTTEIKTCKLSYAGVKNKIEFL
jgi:hypothetical protein